MIEPITLRRLLLFAVASITTVPARGLDDISA
jgi:hypothetical protein